MPRRDLEVTAVVVVVVTAAGAVVVMVVVSEGSNRWLKVYKGTEIGKDQGK